MLKLKSRFENAPGHKLKRGVIDVRKQNPYSPRFSFNKMYGIHVLLVIQFLNNGFDPAPLILLHVGMMIQHPPQVAMDTPASLAMSLIVGIGCPPS